MIELLLAAQMRAIEQAAIDSGEASGLELMERAGQGVVEAIFEEWPELGQGIYEATVFCGPGLTGCIGLFVTKALSEHDMLINLFHCDEAGIIRDASPERLGKLPGIAQQFLKQNGKGDAGAIARLHEGFEENDLIIDAVFGRELIKPIQMYWREVLGWVDRDADNANLVAIDLPSGYHPDTGEFIDFTEAEIVENGYIVEMFADHYDLTLSLTGKCGALKTGRCAAHCGKVVELDIGL